MVLRGCFVVMTIGIVREVKVIYKTVGSSGFAKQPQSRLIGSRATREQKIILRQPLLRCRHIKFKLFLHLLNANLSEFIFNFLLQMDVLYFYRS